MVSCIALYLSVYSYLYRSPAVEASKTTPDENNNNLLDKN